MQFHSHEHQIIVYTNEIEYQFYWYFFLIGGLQMKCPQCDGEMTESGICPNWKKIAIKDSNSFWWFVFALVLPIVAIVLYFVWRTKKPMCAKRLIVGAIISLCILLLVYFIFVILAIIAGGSVFS